MSEKLDNWTTWQLRDFAPMIQISIEMMDLVLNFSISADEWLSIVI